MNNIGARLRALRDARRLSLRAAGALAGVPYAYLYRIEKGEQNPTIAVVARVAHALGGELVVRERKAG